MAESMLDIYRYLTALQGKQPPRVLIAAHRGRFGGNIVENTLPAFEAAIRCGANIVEADIRKTADGVMILYHDPSARRLLGLSGGVESYTLEELRAHPLLNVIGEPSGLYVNTLDEMLTALKGRVMINLDQCWSFLDEVYDRVEAMGMLDQVLIKSRPPYDSAVAWLKSRGWAPSFIPVITRDEEIPLYEGLPAEAKAPIVEVFARSEQDQVLSPAFVASLRDRGRGLWLNALSLLQNVTLCADHDDTLSVTISPDQGWGWLIDHGASVIQTDWTMELYSYISQKIKP